jgi:hypothetical protein
MRVVLAVALMVLVAGCPPLKPGQSRCTTNNVFGTTVTECETGREPPPPAPYVQPYVAPQPAAIFWCTTRQVDGFGVCASEPGWCENARTEGSAPCRLQTYAICSASGCFTTPESCANFERHGKRSAVGCVLRR